MVMRVILLPLQTQMTAMKSSSAQRRKISLTSSSTLRSRRFVCSFVHLQVKDAEQQEPGIGLVLPQSGEVRCGCVAFQVLLELTRQAHQEKTILSLSVCQLGAEGKKRSFDLSITSYLRRVSLDYCDVAGNGRDNQQQA